MKAQERHHLKQNEFVATVARTSAFVRANRDRLVLGAAVLVVALLAGGGYLYWRSYTNDQASALLGTAMTIAEAQIAPPSSLPGAAQAPGTYASDRARQEAALKAFEEVASRYASTPAGLAARYQAAACLLALERFPEAEQAFQDVATRGGSAIYAPMARLGLAETFLSAKQFDKAIAAFTELAADRNGPLPVDGVLIHLAQACEKAGKPQDARAAYKRVVDEFPDSNYVAEARQKLALLG